MAMETVIGYLLALAVPLWLVAEGIMVAQRSRKQPAKQRNLDRLPGKPAPRSPAPATATSRS